MAVSFKLAEVFSLSLSPVLMAVFVCHAVERLVLSHSGIKEMNFLQWQIVAFENSDSMMV